METSNKNSLKLIQFLLIPLKFWGLKKRLKRERNGTPIILTNKIMKIIFFLNKILCILAPL